MGLNRVIPVEHTREYEALSVGTKFVVASIPGEPYALTPIDELAGEVRGSQFYPTGRSSGLLIRTRKPTSKERYETSRASTADLPKPTGFDPSDWK